MKLRELIKQLQKLQSEKGGDFEVSESTVRKIVRG